MKRLSPREQRRLLEKMGLSVKPLENVVEVQIRLTDRVITLRNPSRSQARSPRRPWRCR
jgi:nascent polypeptide-associated complex subunit alpha